MLLPALLEACQSRAAGKPELGEVVSDRIIDDWVKYMEDYESSTLVSYVPPGGGGSVRRTMPCESLFPFRTLRL